MPASFQARWATALVGLAAWAITVPWLAAAVGLELNVATRLEIADHVVPGVVLLAGAALLAIRGAPPGSTVWLGVGAVAFLTGLWITATHVPLIPDALEGVAPWGAALLHLSAGPPILAPGCGCCCAAGSSAVRRAYSERNERSALAADPPPVPAPRPAQSESAIPTSVAPVRVAVVGKGGAGKSVLAGTMARLVARQGTPVLALDSDLFPGLSLSLGSGPDPVEPPLLGASEQDETGQWGWREGVDATIAAQRFATAAPDGVRLLQRGKIAREGMQAITGASKAFWEVAHGLVDAPAFRDWTLIGDLPAGTRQVTEDWAPYAHIYVVLVQPGAQSALTAQRVASHARLRSPDAAVVFIANRVQREQDVRHVEELVGEPVFAALPADEDVAAAESIGAAPIDHAPDSPTIAAIELLIGALARVSSSRLA